MIIVKPQGKSWRGDQSGEEASQIWQNKMNKQKSLVEMIIEVPDEGEYEETAFEKLAKSNLRAVGPGSGIVCPYGFRKRAFNILDANQHLEDCYSIAHLLETTRFATVLLIFRDRVIGVIYVDNKYNNVPINEDDMNFLQMFANQAALAIDNAVLYSNVEQRNRELREAQDQLVQMENSRPWAKCRRILHEIRNPIICVGGFARRSPNDDNFSEK